MKRYIMIMGAAILSLVSCNNVENVATLDGDQSVQLHLNIDGTTADGVVQSRTSVNTRYVLQAFEDQGYSVAAKIFENAQSSSTTSTTSSIDMYISSNKEYHLLLWADDGETYNVSNLKSVTLASGKSEFAEAWQGTFSIINGMSSSYSASLTRAVSRIDLVETGTFSGSSITLSYTGYPQFSVALGNTLGDGVDYDVTYSFSGSITEDTLNASSPLYTFAPVEYANISDFSFRIEATGVDAKSIEITNVPLQANYITSIIGAYSSDAPDLELGEGDPAGRGVVEIPNSNLRKAILSAFESAGITIVNDVIREEDAWSLTGVLSVTTSVADLSGFEHFTNLTGILFNNSGSSFTTLDLSKHTKLTSIKCNNNSKLTEVIFPADKSNIKTLYIFNNSALTALDLTPFTGLTGFYGYSTQFETIDFRKCPDLSIVQFGNNTKLQSIHLNKEQISFNEKPEGWIWVFTLKDTNSEYIINVYEDDVPTQYTVDTFMAKYTNVTYQ